MAIRVLIADDHRLILEGLRLALGDVEGIEIVGATSSGRQVVPLIARTNPDLVLLDMRMPVLDGWGFATALRERGIRLPILVMTAAQDASRWAQEVGAVGFIAKPFDLDDLLDAVEGYSRPA